MTTETKETTLTKSKPDEVSNQNPRSKGRGKSPTKSRKLCGDTKQPPAEAGGFGLRTGSPDTRRLNDASYCGSVLKSSFGFGSK